MTKSDGLWSFFTFVWFCRTKMMLLESNYPLEQEFGVRGTQKLAEMCENAVLPHDLGHFWGGQKVRHETHVELFLFHTTK